MPTIGYTMFIAVTKRINKIILQSCCNSCFHCIMNLNKTKYPLLLQLLFIDEYRQKYTVFPFEWILSSSIDHSCEYPDNTHNFLL